METILPTILLTVIILGISVLGMAVKVFLKPNGEFKGGCASNNPMLRDKVGACGVCGKTDFEETDQLPKIQTNSLPPIG